MAFEKALELPSHHTLNYWRIINLDLDFFGETGRVVFGGYPDENARIQFGDQPVDTRMVRIPKADFQAQLPDYKSILPSSVVADVVTAEGKPFEGATVEDAMTWTKPMSFQGLDVEHWQVTGIRLSWAIRRGRLQIAGYKDEAAFDEDPIANQVQQVPGTLRGYTYTQQEFDAMFDASTQQGTSDSLETTAGFNRTDAYNYAMAKDPFFADATEA